MSSTLRLVPLGGLGEIGMNCMSVELSGRRIVLDCGVAFDGRGLGVDLIHADFSYLVEHRESIEAIVLTHGHEDHLGAVAHFLATCRRHGAFDPPVFGPPYALALLRERLDESEHDRFHELAPGERVEIGPFEVEPFRVTHSMADCLGLIFRSEVGALVHTGDFKIEEGPLDGEVFDLTRLQRLAEEEGVRVLLSDSTNAMGEGRTGREEDVAARLKEIVSEAEGRVVVTLFASNLHRLRGLIDVARQTGRKLCLLGRSLETHARVGQALGRLPGIDAVRIAREDAHDTPPHELLVLATGTQGEPMAAFARLVTDAHYDLRLEEGDTVVHSARIIPGSEQRVFALLDRVARRGMHLHWRGVDPNVHVSGHARREELAELATVLNPDIFVPVHGAYLHLQAHAALVENAGLKQTVVIENGQSLEIDKTSFRRGEDVCAGRIYRSRSAEVPQRVVKDRALMAELGLAVVVFTVDGDGRPVGELDVLTRGVFVEDERQELLDDACDYVHRALSKEGREPKPHPEDLELVAKRALRRFLRDNGHKPLCYAICLSL